MQNRYVGFYLGLQGRSAASSTPFPPRQESIVILVDSAFPEFESVQG